MSFHNPIVPGWLKLAAITAIGVLIVFVFGSPLIEIFRQFSFPENNLPAASGEFPNQDIESKPDYFPAHVQSGIVNIDNKDDLTTYQFGPQDNPSKYLEDQGFVAKGIYVKNGNLWKRIDSLKELNNGDFITITYYQAPGYSDSGKQGKTILGIINLAERQKDGIKISFLDDPDEKTYQLSKSLPLKTEDQLGVFDFGDAVFDGISRGSTLRVLINDKDTIIAATVLAPRTDVVGGKLKQIGFTPVNNEYEIFIESYQQPFFVTPNTKIVERGNPSQLLKISDVPDGSFVTLLYYNNINRHQIMSLDFKQ